MSTKTTFKRIALVAVAALGLGVLSVAPSAQATVFGETLTIDAATDTTTVSDTATAVLTHIASSSTGIESTTIAYTCQAPAGVASCIALTFYQTAVADTANVQDKPNYGGAGTWVQSTDTWSDTTTTTTGTMRSVINVKAVNFATAGTYIYTFYTKDKNLALTSLVPFTWTVTVSAATSRIGTALSNLYVSSDALGYTAETNRKNFAASSDSAVVVDKGSATSYSAVATALAVVKNSAGDTATATAVAAANTASALAVMDTITAILSGPGFLTGLSSTKQKTATFNAYNGATLKSGTNSTASIETLTVWSDGTAGTGTVSLYNSASALIGSFTVTFTGSPASAPSAWLTDTIVPITGQNDSVVAIVKDSAGNTLKSGTVYLYSSDTKVAGSTPTSYPNIGRTAHACTIASTGSVQCPITIVDTGTVTLTLRDSWTVAASTWSSAELTFTVVGTTVASVAVSFDKATYAPGEKAVITITAKDVQGKGLAKGTYSSALGAITSSATMGDITGGAVNGGTCASQANLDADFCGYLDTGIETRVVTMPTFGTTVSYSVRYDTFGLTSGAATKTTVVATATVADPTKDAADAATDAALEATDAAYAAQDAAQLAAEAADAATAAAEAATAAVEDLATQVASLFADLQKQITTLANVVAKIAKKVKA